MIPENIILELFKCDYYDENTCKEKCPAVNYCCNPTYDKEYNDTVKEILKKNIPQKPKRMGEKLDKCWICPSCKTKLDTWCWTHKHTYCEECGQKLEWGE